MKTINRVCQKGWNTVVDKRYRVSIPPGVLGWKIGSRVFWKVLPERPGTAVVSSSPSGTVREGR